MKYEPCPKCRERGKDSRGDNLVRYPSGDGHCFSCGHHVFANWRGPNAVRPTQELKYDKALLPFDFTREVPTHAWKWLLQYGMSYSFWKESVGYSPSTGRLVFAVGSSPENLAFSIGRLVEDKPGRKWHVWGDCHKAGIMYSEQEHSRLSVLVEDLISARKVSQVMECMPLFGTALHPAHLYTLRDGSNRPVVLWLDDDQRGSSQKTAARLQALVNRPVYVRHTSADPKALTLNDINEVLNV